MQQDISTKLLRFSDVTRLIGLSRSSVNRLERAGQFPKRRRISARAIGWLQPEIDQWLASRRTT